MKSHTRSVAAVVLSLALSLQVAPIAAAFPRDGRDDIPEKIIRVLKKLQRFIGGGTHDDSVIPPNPWTSLPPARTRAALHGGAGEHGRDLGGPGCGEGVWLCAGGGR